MGAHEPSRAGAVACTDEKIVFRDPVNPPPDASSGFLGYFSTTDKQTTCGNCHVGMQAQWETTRHAGAYETLAALGAEAQPFCFGCHTVNQRGNAATAAWWMGRRSGHGLSRCPVRELPWSRPDPRRKPRRYTAPGLDQGRHRRGQWLRGVSLGSPPSVCG